MRGYRSVIAKPVLVAMSKSAGLDKIRSSEVTGRFSGLRVGLRRL